MLGWFKKKFGKKEEEIPAPDQEQPCLTETDLSTPSLTAEIASEPSPAATEVREEPTAAIEPPPELQPLPDRSEKKTGPDTRTSSMFQRLSQQLAKTKEALVYRIDSLFLGKKEIDQELLDDLEEILITADLGVHTTQELLDEARRKVKRKELSDPQTLKKVLKEKLRSFIMETDRPAELVMPDKGPFIIMVVGVNGVGKTTTIGKITHKFTNAGQSVLLVAADTFRAAAVAQLKIWGERNKVQVVSQHEGADPSSVVFDAMDLALAQKYDVVIVDTAGRLHTQVNLMEELKKIKRVIGKKIPGGPHEVMLILDATTGQNAISQAKLFNATVDITGLTLTKLDGTAKGGIVVNICRELKIPIRFIGIGEQLEDLRDFDPNEFVEALFQE
jgi:fused signal recognition particle receptor